MIIRNFSSYFICNFIQLFSGKPPNITLRVMSRIEEPFVMYRKEKDGMILGGNLRFEVCKLYM